MIRTPHIFTRLVGGDLCAYVITAETHGPLEPTAVFPIQPGEEVMGDAVFTDLARAAYTTRNAVVCVGADGGEIWRYDLEPRSEQRYGHRPSCAFSLDGGIVWVYRPDGMAGRRASDQWVVLDAGSGTVIAHADLPTVGHGGEHFRHRGGRDILLDVGEGQDGTTVFRGVVDDDGALEVSEFSWNRCLIDFAPGGDRFMTVDHDQSDVAFHTYPDGEVTLRLSVEAFGGAPSEAYLEWSGGYLDSDTAIVTLAGETDDEQDWHRHHRVDLRTGRVGAEFDAHSRTPYDILPLGDGSWLTTEPDGRPVRRRSE
jgi:hypothetical protein